MGTDEKILEEKMNADMAQRNKVLEVSTKPTRKMWLESEEEEDLEIALQYPSASNEPKPQDFNDQTHYLHLYTIY